MSKDKILITGFPHTGTTIFKAKIGECNNVFEYPYECDFLRDIELVGKGDTEFIVTKSPSIPIEIKKYGLEKLASKKSKLLAESSIMDESIIIQDDII